MKKFPPGSWELDEYDEFQEWRSAIKAGIPSTKTTREIIVLLPRLSVMLTEVNEPLQFEDEGSESAEEEEEEEVPAPRRSQRSVLPASSIRVSRKTDVVEVDDGEDLVPNEPRVRRLVVYHNLSDICRL